MAALSALLRGYAQILFSRSQVVGGLLLLATWVIPTIGLHGLVASVTALVCAKLLGLPDEATDEGIHSYNAVLTGLAVGALFSLSLLSLGLAVVGACAAVLATAAFRSLGTGLPVLTLPFLVALWGLVAFSGRLPPAPEGLLPTLGALFFVPDTRAGLLVLVALVLWSRQGAVLAGLGLLLALGVRELSGVTPPPLLEVNLALVMMAVGGVWFVPSRSSVAVATLGACVATLVGWMAAPFLFRLGLPMSIAPFNIAVLVVLLAMRQRVEDRAPKAVDTLPGTPEQNLAYHTTRSARFGARYAVRMRAPVLGSWVVTQSEDDGPTHRAAWKHALDLEVQGPGDLLHRGDGSKLKDWLCYRLPVIAPADGTVVRVIDGVRDNPVGHVDLEDNWGNVVVLFHGPGLYSLVAHLSPGTLEVQEGQNVRQGDVLGRCGSSGRSPHPHLHFQLQGTPVVGAPTLPLELHDVVDSATGELKTTWSPHTGDQVRNLQVDDDLAKALDLRPGSHSRWRHSDTEVEVEVAVDALGTPSLRDGSGRMVFSSRDDLLTLFAPLAPAGSMLHVFRAALARVPLEPGLSWTDPLPPHATLPILARPLWEVLSMFVPWSGTPVAYRLEADGAGWVVTGRTPDGAIETRAAIDRTLGPVEVQRTLRGRTTRVERMQEEARVQPREEVAR